MPILIIAELSNASRLRSCVETEMSRIGESHSSRSCGLKIIDNLCGDVHARRLYAVAKLHCVVDFVDEQFAVRSFENVYGENASAHCTRRSLREFIHSGIDGTIRCFAA